MTDTEIRHLDVSWLGHLNCLAHSSCMPTSHTGSAVSPLRIPQTRSSMAHTSSDLFLLHRPFPLLSSSQTVPISLESTCPYNSPSVHRSFVLQGLRMSTEKPLAQGGFGSLGVFCAVAPWLQLSLSKERGKVSIELKVTSKFPLSQAVFFLRPFHSRGSCWLSGSPPLLVDPAALSASLSHELTWGYSIAMSSVLWGNTNVEISASILLLIWHVDRIGWHTLG